MIRMNQPQQLQSRPDFSEHMLDVGDGHKLHWTRHGNPDGPTVLLVHCGPGSGIFLRCGEFFDPQAWNVDIYDQRGCGKSTPTAATTNNSTAHLVWDIEQLRIELGVGQLVLHGVSWGTRLALAYGVAHLERCAGFLLCSIFLGRQVDIDWLLWNVRIMFPENHDGLLDAVEAATGVRPATPSELLAVAGTVFSDESHGSRQQLANEWDDYEWRMMSVAPMPPPPTDPGEVAHWRAKSLTQAILEHHCMARILPLEEDITGQVSRIGHVPCEIVHGRHDVICPAGQASLLAARWQKADLQIAAECGHRIFDPGMAELIHAASARLLSRITAGEATSSRQHPSNDTPT